MTVLDAYAVISFLRDENAAEEVAELLRRPTLLTTVSLVEVLDQMVRVYSRAADDVEADLALLSETGMSVIPLDPACAVLAGRLRARHYHRERCAVSLADCLAVAATLWAEWPLATADPALVRLEQGEVVGLPDRRGDRP